MFFPFFVIFYRLVDFEFVFFYGDFLVESWGEDDGDWEEEYVGEEGDPVLLVEGELESDDFEGDQVMPDELGNLPHNGRLIQRRLHDKVIGD